ncbi:MAG: sodium-translocating pyrophosphatase [Deltaproteobacteria bacterium]|nr:sodium-translocating pyrophosphatase [Deltaproteobacteria bacterium]
MPGFSGTTPTLYERFGGGRLARVLGVLFALALVALPSIALASEIPPLPDLGKVTFFGNDPLDPNGLTGKLLLYIGLGVCILGGLFGVMYANQLKKLPVHKSMLEISELIYETCKAYLRKQGKFILVLFIFIGAVMVAYLSLRGSHAPVAGSAAEAAHLAEPGLIVKIIVTLVFGLIGIAGSYGVAWFGIRINTYANSRAAFAGLRGLPFPTYAIPLKAGMSIGMLLISTELIMMLAIILFVPPSIAGISFLGFAVGESLGASALRIAGGIFTKIADIGSDLMKIVFNIKEDDARNPGVIADCTGDNAGDSVGPSADGFETYGVTGVALITFILLAVPNEIIQVQLLVWIFVMRIMMIVTSALSYFINEAMAKSKYGNAKEMDFEKPLTNLVFLTSFVSIVVTYAVSALLIPNLGGDTSQWWKLSTIITCGTIAGALIPELVKVFTSTHSAHVKEVVQASKEGGASLNILAGLTAGNFSAYWLGIAIVGLMAVAYWVSHMGFQTDVFLISPLAAGVFAFGLVAFGFLGMGPVTIAVDSYGPVTDNAQSVFELSLIETSPGIKDELQRDFGFTPDFEAGKHFLEANDGAGNTFKATAKPVLIGTAVVGATTLIFSIIMLLADRNAAGVPQLATVLGGLSILNAPFLLGLVTGGAIIYWFTGASTQAVSTGAYRAVEFIKANIKLDGSSEKASVEDSKKVVEICTEYAQQGMKNIFFGVFFSTLAFAFADPFYFIGYLISIALFGLYQAIFMANAGGAWDNAKKLVEVELKAKNTPLHEACVVGDTVGDPFKDTSSVAMNPVIKFTTLFGLLAVELSLQVKSPEVKWGLAAGFFIISTVFVWRSFYAMRIKELGIKS